MMPPPAKDVQQAASLPSVAPAAEDVVLRSPPISAAKTTCEHQIAADVDGYWRPL